jgi:hypothetical protein
VSCFTLRNPTSFKLLAVLTLAVAPPALAEVWYDASLGTLPEAQGWTFFTLPAVTPSLIDGAAVLDTSGSSLIRGGWTRFASPALDRQSGVRLEFTAELAAESHASIHRAGFSVILLDQQKRGIELGFWTDRIWAQSDVPLFNHAEEVEFATQGRLVSYGLTLGPDAYELLADGARILGGPLRDYTAFVGNFDVYESPNLVFLGDDTTSANARVRVSRVALERGTLVRNPPALTVSRSEAGIDLRWPAAPGGTGWVLESAPDPVAGPWTVNLATQTLVESAGRSAVTVALPAAAEAHYFRLR